MENQWLDLVPRNTLLEYYRMILTSNNVFLISMAVIDVILVVALRYTYFKNYKKY